MNNWSKSFSRRNFLAGTTSLGALYAAKKFASFPVSAQSLPDDPRISQQPVIDKGFAMVRKIGNGVYATVSDRTKGPQTRCNGGFFVGRDAALLIEGFQTPTGAAFQLEALRMVSKVPVRAAINSHWHFDHIMGNSHYGGNGIPIWAHAKVPTRIMEHYPKWQSEDLATFLIPWEKRLSEARTDTEREHAKSNIEALTGSFLPVTESVLAFPNHLLDPAKMPMSIDLGGLTVVIETHIGHTDTDLIFRVPDQKLVFTGDLLVNAQYSTNLNGYPTPWHATLEKLAALDKDTLFVPGHGEICGIDGVKLNISVFDDIREQAEKLYKAGVPAEEAGERYVVPEKFKNFRQYCWGFAITRTIQQHYAEMSGKPVAILSYD